MNTKNRIIGAALVASAGASLCFAGTSPVNVRIVDLNVVPGGIVQGYPEDPITGTLSIDTSTDSVTGIDLTWDGRSDGFSLGSSRVTGGPQAFGPDNRYTEISISSPFTLRDYFDIVLDFGGPISSYHGGDVNGSPVGTDPPYLDNQFGYGFGGPDSCAIFAAGSRGEFNPVISGLTFAPEAVVATPEAATITMVLFGFTSLGLAGYRRSRKALAPLAA